MKDRVAMPARSAGHQRRSRRALALALLALGSQAGCGREFYREWANQDVSEAVFEKSRDPRWRLDQFSIEPPTLSRFADPYDQDRPPAPPDDFPTQALSPVPQWPDHRLEVPVEGAGYLKLLDEGPRYTSPPRVLPPNPDANKRIVIPGSTGTPPAAGASPFTPGTSGPAPDPIPNGNSAPGATPANGPGVSLRRNSGTGDAALTPTSLAKVATPRPSGTGAGKDGAVRRAANQEPAGTMPTQTAPTPTVPISPDTPPPRSTTTTGEPLRTPQLPMDPLPTDTKLNVPVNPRPDLSGRDYRESERQGSSLAGLFVPANVPFDEAVAAGLPSTLDGGAPPYILTMEKAFQIALVNSRTYQTQIENVYLSALPVTLQRFSFQPQFIAGITPTTGVGGNGSTQTSALTPTVNPANSFLYNTREAGNQLSTLNLGTVAGVGKLADNGTRVLASFANSVVFNFLGKNPLQPTVRSFLPVQVLVPFLRGGGRAYILEGLTQAERNLLYSIRSFALFRQQFTVATLIGGNFVAIGSNLQTGGFSAGSGNVDPTIGFLNAVEDVQVVENNVKNLAVYERFAEVFKDLIEGESSGLSKLQLDQINQQVQNARQQLIQSQTQYRNDIDQYKFQIGMPPDTPLIVDRSRTLGFKQVYEEIDRWSLSDRRELTDLGYIVAKLPKLEDVVIDGRSCQEVFTDRSGKGLENLLVIAERVALENRLDLMNARAGLYDAWRQIRVTANALKGYLNVSVTNQFVTPPTTNNPFGFLDQAKNFSLVFNAELPLVRVAERNNFRSALITYQRQRRALQNTEDVLKYQLRNEIRAMQLVYETYQIAQRNLVLTVSQKDQAFEQIIAPPTGTQGNVNAATQTLNLIQAQGGVINNENTLVTNWYNYQIQRLQVYRDLGILPYDEWEAFDELFPPNRAGRTGNPALDGDRRPAPAGRPGGDDPGTGRSPAGLGSPLPVTPAAAAGAGAR